VGTVPTIWLVFRRQDSFLTRVIVNSSSSGCYGQINYLLTARKSAGHVRESELGIFRIPRPTVGLPTIELVVKLAQG